MAYFRDRIAKILTILGVVSLIATTPLTQANAEDITANHAVVELYTSQGCSSCPPADKILGKLAKRKDITALTLPVDYWDYIGWKDTLASRQFSNRQRTYAKYHRERGIYTPQMVVNGVTHAVGSRQFQVEAAIKKAQQEFATHAVPLKMTVNKNTIWVNAGDARSTTGETSGTVWIACVKKAISVDIRRGENAGRTVTYHNVVRQLTPIGQWMGKSIKLRLPRHPFVQDGPDFFVALLQSKDTGRIIGVARIEDL